MLQDGRAIFAFGETARIVHWAFHRPFRLQNFATAHLGLDYR
jgi:hypothetical protein